MSMCFIKDWNTGRVMDVENMDPDDWSPCDKIEVNDTVCFVREVDVPQPNPYDLFFSWTMYVEEKGYDE